MVTRREDGHEIDTSAERLDVDLVHRWLSTDAYWAMGRSADVVAASIHNSLSFGTYGPDGALVGFARVVTDHATFAWICDVYIEPSARGLGLGTWLAQVIVNDLREQGLPRVILATLDAHAVYARAGFVPLAEPQRWMEIDLRGTGYGRTPGELADS